MLKNLLLLRYDYLVTRAPPLNLSQSTKKTETPSEKGKEAASVSSAVSSKENDGLRNRK